MATVEVTVELDRLDLTDATSARPVTGRHVDNLQGLLLATRRPEFDPGPIDGQAGDRTKRALREFKRQNDLTADFIVGPRTWEKLIEF